jgi:uncharacterized protein with GYD domain
MPTYIALVSFSDKGIQAVRETTKRAATWAAKVKSLGVTVKQSYWTLGNVDGVCIFEAPDDETATTAMLSAGVLGSIRTQTLRAFTAEEIDKILAKMV